MRRRLIILSFAFFLACTIGAPVVRVHAQTAPCDASAKFCPLAPIPGLTDASKTSVVNSDTLANFLNNLYKYLIGVAATAAVIMIIWGGIDISTTDSIGNQSAGKQRIRNAIGGLILVLMPVVVFSVINPSILNLSLNLPALDTKSGKVPTTTGGTCYENSDCASNLCKTGVSILNGKPAGTCVDASSLRERGEECSENNQCKSGECDTVNRSPGICRDRSAEPTLILDGGSCTENMQCASTVCDLETKKCAASGDFPTNARCTRDAQCRSKECSLHGDGKYACNSGERMRLF